MLSGLKNIKFTGTNIIQNSSLFNSSCLCCKNGYSFTLKIKKNYDSEFNLKE